MRYAIIQSGSVVNIAEANGPLGVNWVADPNSLARIGGTWDGLNFIDPVVDTAAIQKQADLDAAISTDTVIANLKAMSVSEFDAWWSANVTTLAQADTVLKRVTRVVLRRVL